MLRYAFFMGVLQGGKAGNRGFCRGGMGWKGAVFGGGFGRNRWVGPVCVGWGEKDIDWILLLWYNDPKIITKGEFLLCLERKYLS